jgi:uncharacterized protein (UPF0276 family)
MGVAPAATPIPATAGIGLRAAHYRALLARPSPVGWLEAHSENYFGDGGQPLWFLERLRADHPLSLHGVGLSLGSVDPLPQDHLHRLKVLIDRFEPALVSEHLSWGAIEGRHANDLLPLPYTEEALAHVTERIEAVQTSLGRQILIENVSSYLQFADSTIPEWDFLVAAAQRSDCAILLDLNNVYVNAVNHGFDPRTYLRAIPSDLVAEIHLAGFDRQGNLLVDTHGKPVQPPVWALYAEAVHRLGPKPTLIEWDTDIPELEVLLAEAAHARSILEDPHGHAA